MTTVTAINAAAGNINSERKGDFIEALSERHIHIKDGFNPRYRVDESSDSFRELVDSIKAQGVVQPIVVRPRADADGYWLIAGERRLRALRAAGLATVPATVRYVTDGEALEIALVENAAREDVTPIEEAQSAHAMMDVHNGNREEVMARLGWSRSKLDRRLLLIHAAEPVRVAFLDGLIPLQMVELLAGIPAESQVGTMNAAIEKKFTIAELKSRLEAATAHLTLDTAIFDTQGCADCQHNSTAQADLFSAHIASGRCMNRACYGEKVKVALEAKKVALAEDYNVIFLDTEKLPSSHVVLTMSGSDGVGSDQFTACKGCGNFGALMVTAPGREGSLTTDVCFDLPCHSVKVAEYAREIAASAVTGPTSASTKAATPKGEGAKKAAPAKKVNSIPSKVTDMVDAFYREQAGTLTIVDSRLKMAAAAHALLKDAYGFDMSAYGAGKTSRADLVEQFYQMQPTSLALLLSDMAIYVMAQKAAGQFDSKDMVRTAERVVKITNTDLVGRFILTADFLKAHTKAGIEALMTEATTSEGQSFPDWYDSTTGKEGSFKALMGKKVDELVDTILSCGFDFSKFVPVCVSQRITK